MRLSDPYRLSLAAGERWAEPLGDLIGRVLAADLNQRLPGRLVFSAAGSLTMDADQSVAVDIQRFDADAGRVVTLAAQVSVDPARGSAAGRNLRLTAQAADGATQTLAATMSLVLGQLADQIAALVSDQA